MWLILGCKFTYFLERITKISRKSCKSHKKAWVVVILILLTAAVGAGVFFYANHLRKSTAEPMEMVPADAALTVQVNDYESFAKAMGFLRGYITDAVPLGAFDGMQYFLQQFTGQPASSSTLACSATEIEFRIGGLISLRNSQMDFDDQFPDGMFRFEKVMKGTDRS